MLRRIFTSQLHPVTANLVRHLRTRRGDPGLRLRMKEFADDFVQHDPETAESLEPDFMNVHAAQKEFMAQEKKHQAKVPRHIVGQKYFKLKQPNFLTWAEKEQMKLLHQQRPEEWTFERLSSSFPADPETIKEIIRNRWQPRDEKRILKHDEKVNENWRKLKKGEIEVEPILAQHLATFTKRRVNRITPPKVKVEIARKFAKPETNEFSSIITTCKKYKEVARNDEVVDERQAQLNAGELKFGNRRYDPEDNNTALLVDNNPPKSVKGITFEDFIKKNPHLDIKHPDDEAKETFEYAEEKEEEEEVEKEPEPDYRMMEKFETKQKKSAVELRVPNETSLRNLEIQDRIKIPKTVYNKESTYKVGDCFYDSDGRFLYRVPGLMN